MEEAKLDFEAELETDGLPSRSIGWFRADIETYPELDIDGEGVANQLVISTQFDLRRLLGYTSRYYERH